jgi:hypothetical protein
MLPNGLQPLDFYRVTGLPNANGASLNLWLPNIAVPAGTNPAFINAEIFELRRIQ